MLRSLFQNTTKQRKTCASHKPFSCREQEKWKRMRSEEEAVQGKTFQELSLTQHLPNHKMLHSTTTDTTRTMAAFMYYTLHKLLTGKARSQQACSEDFGCKMTLFKHLVTGKRHPGRLGRKGEGCRSSRTVEEVKQLESSEPTQKRPKCTKKDKK